MNQTQYVPYSDEIRQLMRKKSGILFSAHRRKDDGILDEATAMFIEAGELEEQIARLLENDSQPKAEGVPVLSLRRITKVQRSEHSENAVIHWVSAASCYMNAGDFSRAGKLFEFILTKDIRPRLRREVKKFKKRCETENKKKPKIGE
ncbi:hypothetical protein FJZ31_14430 [Candidatus Poribacteria bacterium]|nr:hypothetical protein [Candidatus Poribacteria bacterium]